MREQSFDELSDAYPVLFLDAFGVLRNSDGLIPGSLDVMDRLRDRGKDIYILTNDASRSPEELARVYVDAEDRQMIPASRIISSGTLASDYLAQQIGSGQVGYLGSEKSAEYIRRAGLAPVPIGICTEETTLCAIALLDDEGFDWMEGLNRTLNLLRAEPLPVVVANSDLAYPTKGGLEAVAIGSLARLLEQILDTKFVRCGKPEDVMFSKAFERAKLDHPGLRRSDVLMVGDTLQTDIKGGEAFGLDTLLVLSGHTQASRLAELVEKLDIEPTFFSDSILT
jgi:HAD superfamily hydrolase (TIGR01450 family)